MGSIAVTNVVVKISFPIGRPGIKARASNQNSIAVLASFNESRNIFDINNVCVCVSGSPEMYFLSLKGPLVAGPQRKTSHTTKISHHKTTSKLFTMVTLTDSGFLSYEYPHYR